MKRRKFIKISALSAGMAGIGLGTACDRSVFQSGGNPLINAFNNPDTVAKPFARWWWNGNILDKEEIERQLTIMSEGGIGGVEITPISLADEATPTKEEPTIWLSDEWLDILKFTTQTAHRKNMQVDMIVGTGWPFGGDFLEEDETIQGIELKIFDLEGPGRTTIDNLLEPKDYTSRIMQLVMVPENCQSPDQPIDLLDQVNANAISFEVPEGKYRLHMVSWRQNYDQVYFGAPGGQGPVLDHFNVNAVKKYLTRTSDRLKKVFPDGIGEHVRSMFCDSIELHGANWTNDFSEEFATRRGYEIEPYLPFILRGAPEYEEMKVRIQTVRYDFHKTLSELFIERFLQEFHQWCQRIGVKSRYQAYGYPYLYTHMTDGSMVPDIPEGDQFLYNGSWQRYANINDIRYAVWNKYASSGGQLAQRDIVSSEAMSNLDGVFRTTLAYKKQATDLDFAGGVNHLILHGYNYSPPEAGFPGWIRFGTYYSDQNTWWPYFHAWSAYTARVSAVLQKARRVPQIAILSPIEDTWAKYGFNRDSYNYNPWYLHSIWQALNHNGCQTDYISPDVLLKSTAQNDLLTYNGVQFYTLLVLAEEYMHKDVANKLEELNKQGVKIIILGDLPTKVLNDPDEEAQPPFSNPEDFTVVRAPGAGEQKSQQALADFTRQLISAAKIEPQVKVSEPSASFFYQIAQQGTHKAFHLINSSENEDLQMSVQLPLDKDEELYYCIPENGKVMKYPHQNGKINLKLLPTGALLLISASTGISEEKYQLPGNETEPMATINPWKIHLVHFNGDQQFHSMNELTDLSNEGGFENFSGTITYENTFAINREDIQYLDLGTTQDAAEVFINGKSAGIRWHRGQLLDVSDFIKKGENTIKIVVKSTMFNYARTLKDNKVAMRWVNRARNKSSVPTGLLQSPVFLN